MHNLLSSLKVRIVVSALLLILVLLPIIGITLNNAFETQVNVAAKNQLKAYVYSVLAMAEVEDNELQMPSHLLENQFNVIGSGLYALITTKDNQLLWTSNSFLGLNTPINLPKPATGRSTFDSIMINDKPLLIYSFSVSFATSEQPFTMTLHIIKNKQEYLQQIQKFSNTLWTWLLILTALLVIVQLSWLLWTLKPLGQFSQELTAVEQGTSMQLSTHYPVELQKVAKQLNTLLQTEQNQRKRYRNALADLAHSLKTPLAVIQTQADLSEASLEQINRINQIIAYQLRRAQSAAGSGWHIGISVDSIAVRLVRTLSKIYQHRNLTIEYHPNKQARFKGDEADLTEMLGNVLDNACKAAKTRVTLTLKQQDNQLWMTIEDDGEGIPEEKQQHIFERGIRADTYAQGHGIGLAIVRDLVDSYHGNLTVGQSASLQGAKFEFTFEQ
ncbi:MULTISPECIES: ATP-binding protein [Shewanella]|jgi:two-component system sensor histidine kinase PhoQ|uniref:histidine kinase n=1 Tax=Shewanella psychromarinicola TaxID=2487742 RepID=A0A3N4E9Y7_9GAMM|nr:ATP-binding protein [Shewanella psychromarinicola]AZG37040.1 GHKL domain-containing protein [Shewanella psychromarinicola]MCL1081118.1 ATP-binding protein [Shewanella psychromarinicola]RPA34893.1 GHKL domain-containing protein [Shewanella psychromarinicola]